MSSSETAALEVRDLAVQFPTPDGIVKAVAGLSFTLRRGETFGIVGESGSGKSVTNLADPRPAQPQARAASRARSCFKGKDLLKASPAELRDVRGKDIAMIFQDPFACLHPMYRVGDQIAEAVRAHEDVSKKQALRPRGRAARRGRHPERRASAPRTTRTSSRAACASAR